MAPRPLGAFTPAQLDWALEWVFRHPNDTSPNTAKATALLVEGVKFYRLANEVLTMSINSMQQEHRTFVPQTST